MTEILNQIANSVDMIQQRLGNPSPISVGIILGSGLGDFADQLTDRTVIPYADIPHFPLSRVQGHAGNLIIGELSPGFRIVCMQGRFHYYEGHDLETVTFPIRVLRNLGIQTLIVTNAAGGIRADLSPGQLMLITDQINLTGVNPLRGEHHEAFGPRFPDMSEAYSHSLQDTMRQAAKAMDLQLKEGVYLGLSGPCYETPAEVRMLKTLGADAVGMSTVFEVIVANQMGLAVAGVSCITNAAAGVSADKLSHEEVMHTAAQSKNAFMALLNEFFRRLHE